MPPQFMPPQAMPPQTAFDNSSLSIYKDCPRKYLYAIVQGWRPRHESYALTFGTAFHAAVEEYHTRKLDPNAAHDDCVKSALRKAMQHMHVAWDDSYRNPFTLLRAVVWYADYYCNDPLQTVVLASGKPALELSFRFALPVTTSTGESYIYCGHIDRIARLGNAVYCVDYKTTTSALGESYFARYNPNAQISGYSYAAQILFMQPVQGFVIDAVQLGVSFNRFSRHIAPRTKEQLDEWLENTIAWVKRIEHSYRTDTWPMNEESCTKYGSCQFREICNKTPGIRDNFLRAGFVINHWDPLKNRGDT